METNSTNKSTNLILIIIAIGIWANVYQNSEVMNSAKSVRVINEVETRITGGSVNVGNTVDINIEAINGHSDAFYDSNGSRVYNRIPVYTFGY